MIGWILAAARGYQIQEEDIGSMATSVLMVVGSTTFVFAPLLTLGTFVLAPAKKGAPSPASHQTG